MTNKLVALAAAAAISGLCPVLYPAGARADEAAQDKGYGYQDSYGKYEDNNGYKTCEYKNDEGYKYSTYNPYDISFQKYYKFAKLKCTFDVPHPYYDIDHGFRCSYKIKDRYKRYRDVTYYSYFYVDVYAKKAYLTCIFKDYDEHQYKD